jgi:2-desacetyl-2-hydroxyethyl bacteriochlorophyllide A dehydrogenase
MLSKRAYLTEPGKFEIKTEDIQIRPDELLVKIALCGLCNWELNHWKGEADPYRVYPKVIGHEWVGVVTEMGADVRGFSVGDKVTVLPGNIFQGFAEYCPVKASECFKLDKGAEVSDAMGEPLKCIVTVLRAAAPEAGDTGVVLGCGPMGLWCVQGLAGHLVSKLIAVDVDDNKLKLARSMGATDVINSGREGAADAVFKITDGHMADFVIEGTGIPALLNQSVTYLKNGGRLILMSSHGEACKEFDFRPAIERGIDIKMAHPGHSQNQADDMRRAVDMINSGTFSNKGLISHIFKLEEINEAFQTLEHKPEGYIKGIIKL